MPVLTKKHNADEKSTVHQTNPQHIIYFKSGANVF